MARQDILMKADDLDIENGDFVIGPSDLQHVYHIVLLPQGSWKQNPLTGVGRSRFLNGPLDGAIRRDVQLQLQADGYRLKTLDFKVAAGQQELDISFDSA